jgi:hypothetical protein
MNGAVQGLAASTASTPEPKASTAGRLRPPAGQALRQQVAQLEGTHQVQTQRKEQQGQHEDHARLLQLEAPADGTAGGPQRQQQPGQRQEAEHHAGAVGQRVAAQAGWLIALLRQPQQLDRQHREHAGHQVEHHAAHQRHRQGSQQAEAGSSRARAARGSRCCRIAEQIALATRRRGRAAGQRIVEPHCAGGQFQRGHLGDRGAEFDTALRHTPGCAAGGPCIGLRHHDALQRRRHLGRMRRQGHLHHIAIGRAPGGMACRLQQLLWVGEHLHGRQGIAGGQRLLAHQAQLQVTPGALQFGTPAGQRHRGLGRGSIELRRQRARRGRRTGRQHRQ